MKKIFTFGAALSLTLTLGACQDSEEGQGQDEAEIAYDYFDLEVDYENLDDAYVLEYEKANNGLDIDITDNLTDREYDTTDDSEAFEEVLPAFEQLDFDENTPDEEVAQQIVDAFGFKENYEKIELEVDFSDGGEKEFTINNS
jgi:hypothetical protein